MENVIENFIKEMIKKAGIDNMPEDFKKEYTEKLGVEVQQRLGIMALQELDENGLKEFETLMKGEEEPDPQKLLDFFQGKIPHFNEKYSQTLKQFAEEFISGAERLKGKKLNV
jgi:uncharacterized protein YdiU (UPF0061 family)